MRAVDIREFILYGFRVDAGVRIRPLALFFVEIRERDNNAGEDHRYGYRSDVFDAFVAAEPVGNKYAVRECRRRNEGFFYPIGFRLNGKPDKYADAKKEERDEGARKAGHQIGKRTGCAAR